MAIYNVAFGNWLKIEAKRRNWNADKFGEVVGELSGAKTPISRTAIYNWWNGEMPDEDKYEPIARALEIPFGELMAKIKETSSTSLRGGGFECHNVKEIVRQEMSELLQPLNDHLSTLSTAFQMLAKK